MSKLNIHWLVSLLAAVLFIAFQLPSTSVSADANETSANNPNAIASASLTVSRFSTCVNTNVGAVKCWGSDNISGAAGAMVVPTQVPGLTSGATALASTNDSHCVLLDTGGVKCWGNGTSGLLGTGTTNSTLTPVDVFGLTSGVKAIAGGHSHMCALLIAGTVKCWGSNNSFQLGAPSVGQTYTSYPTTVSNLSGVTALSAGDGHTCALLDTTTMRCWGHNSYGQLGNQSLNSSSTAVDVSNAINDYANLSGVVAITTGDWHTCALKSNNQAYCWGRNNSGQLGVGDYYGRFAPTLVTVTNSNISTITGGSFMTCVLLSSGAVKCWGNSQWDARIGDGSITSGAIAVSSGEHHSCAVFSTGAVKCWGENVFGELGNGTKVASYVPVQVAGLTNSVGVSTTTTTTTTSTTTTTTLPPTTSSSTSTSTSTSTSSSTIAPMSSATSTTPAPSTSTTSTVPAGMASQIANNSSTTTLVQPSNSLPNSGDSTTSTSLLPVSTTTTTTTTIPLTVEIANGSTKAIASAMSKDATGKAVIYLNGKKTEATVTREQDNITVTVAGTRTQLRATAPDGTSINITGDGVLVVKHGSHVSTATTGFAAYSSVESWCYSTPTKLGTEQSDEAGATTGRYLITDKIPSGKHHLVIRGTNSTGQSLTIGFAMRVTEDSLIVRFATSPFVWLILIVALLIALFIPGRIRHKEDSIQ